MSRSLGAEVVDDRARHGRRRRAAAATALRGGAGEDDLAAACVPAKENTQRLAERRRALADAVASGLRDADAV